MRRTLTVLSRSLLLATLASGCANNAIFELTLHTPPAESGRVYAVVEALPDGADFGDDWQQSQIGGIPLNEMEDNVFVPSFEASGDDIATPLLVKLRFCVGPRCQDIADGSNAPEVQFTFERAFYKGRYTTYEYDLTAIPPTGVPLEVPVGKCAIVGEGCREGASMNNCVRGDVHFCEDI